MKGAIEQLALTKPILNSVNSWDVSEGQIFTFNVVGGDQVVGNTLYIVNNETNVIVYTLNTTSYQYKAIVPANATGLSNGVYYSAYIVTRNSSNQTSAPSNTIQFYCYTKPSWAFSNISEGTIVNNSSVIPIVSYNQIEGEALSSYTINLYNSSQNLLSSSGTIYTGSSSSSQSVSFSFYGLEDNTAYYVRAFGTTVGGTGLDTNYIGFTVSYVAPESFNVLVVQNNCDEGYITYYSLAYGIEGTSNPSPPTYVTNSGEIGVDLRNDGSWVQWDSENNNFIVPEDFTLKAWVLNPTIGKDLIVLTDEKGQTITLHYGYYLYDTSKVYVSLLVKLLYKTAIYERYYNAYECYSNLIPVPNDGQNLCIQLRKLNNLYEIIIGVA